VLACVRGQYAGSGPTLAGEYLASCHGCKRSAETLRQWMLADALWAAKRAPSLPGVEASLAVLPALAPAYVCVLGTQALLRLCARLVAMGVEFVGGRKGRDVRKG
jgi:hypothetical protein